MPQPGRGVGGWEGGVCPQGVENNCQGSRMTTELSPGESRAPSAQGAETQEPDKPLASGL